MIAESWGQEPRRAVFCACGWARLFDGLRAANAAIERHREESTGGLDLHAYVIEDA